MKLGKKLLGENDREVGAILDRLTLEEAQMTGTTTLEVVYDLLKNMKMIMDGAQDSIISSLHCNKYFFSHLDRSMLMDDIRRTLGVFVSLSTSSVLTVVAVDMQQVASTMNKSRRVFNPDSRLLSVMANMAYKVIRRWLSPPDPSINHNTARNAHHEGSAKWFIDGNIFQRWKMGTGSLLWVHGKRKSIPFLFPLPELRP